MRILAFESSAKAASVALVTDRALTAESFQNRGLTHSVTLLTMARDLLRQTDLTVNDVDFLAVAEGPGSFTGVRIGVAAVKGLSWGAEIPCIGVSALESMAQLHRMHHGIICAVMDARRNQVYNALFRAESGNVERITPDRAISIEALENELLSFREDKILVGDGALLCYNCMESEKQKIFLAPEPFRHQRALGVALAAYDKTGEYCDAEALSPTYLRMSQAEREREARLTKEKT